MPFEFEPFFNNGSFSAVAVGPPVAAIHIQAGATAACPVDASRAAVDIVEGVTPVGRYDFSRAIPVSNCSRWFFANDLGIQRRARDHGCHDHNRSYCL